MALGWLAGQKYVMGIQSDDIFEMSSFKKKVSDTNSNPSLFLPFPPSSPPYVLFFSFQPVMDVPIVIGFTILQRAKLTLEWRPPLESGIPHPRAVSLTQEWHPSPRSTVRHPGAASLTQEWRPLFGSGAA